MCPAVGTGARVLVHETLTVFTADLGTLLGWNWLSLLLRSISRDWLAIAWTHRHSISRIWIVRRSGSVTAVTLLNRISAWLRHVPRHGLWHAARGNKRNLRLPSQVRSSFYLYYRFETVLHGSATPSGPTRRYPNTEWKGLSRTTPKIRGPGYLNVSREENVLSALPLLKSLVVNGDPDHFLIAFENSCFDFDTEGLNVLMSLYVHLPNYCFSFDESWFVKTNPDLSLRSF